MANLNALLTYQTIDKKLFKIEKEISQSNERKEYIKLKKFMEQSAEKLDNLDAKAKQLMAVAKSLTEKYLELEKTLGEFDHIQELTESGADVSFYQKNALILMDKLKSIKAELNALMSNIEETSKDYQNLKKQVITAQSKYTEAKAGYEQVKSSKDDEKSSIEKELKVAEKDVEPELLEKYKMKRKEKIFPIVGKLNGDMCPFCSMQQPIAAISALHGGELKECESCHRLIYKE